VVKKAPIVKKAIAAKSVPVIIEEEIITTTIMEPMDTDMDMDDMGHDEPKMDDIKDAMDDDMSEMGSDDLFSSSGASDDDDEDDF